MLFQPRHSLEERIIVYLSRHPFQTAVEIRKGVANGSKLYSIQAIFKELKKLHQQGILIHERPRYAVSLTWASELSGLTRTIELTALSPNYVRRCLPQEEGKQSWKFSDLFRLKNFWSQLVVMLIKQHPGEPVLSWNPHPLFYLAYSKHESQLMNALKSTNTKMFKIVGGNFALDHWAEQFWDPKYVEYSFAVSPYQRDRRLYFSAVGDYLVTAKLAESAAQKVDKLFCSVSRVQALDVREVMELMQHNSKVVLTIERSHRKLQLHRNRFERFFGKLELSKLY